MAYSHISSIHCSNFIFLREIHILNVGVFQMLNILSCIMFFFIYFPLVFGSFFSDCKFHKFVDNYRRQKYRSFATYEWENGLYWNNDLGDSVQQKKAYKSWQNCSLSFTQLVYLRNSRRKWRISRKMPHPFFASWWWICL